MKQKLLMTNYKVVELMFSVFPDRVGIVFKLQNIPELPGGL
jgi:hypothetical protein